MHPAPRPKTTYPQRRGNAKAAGSAARPSRVELTARDVLDALEGVKDPEIPVVSVVDLGIVQSVEVEDGHVTVAITPTFTGCPALEVMRAEIVETVRQLGATGVEVPVVLHPAWSSDRMAPAARERLRSIGLAPPLPAQGRFRADINLSAATSTPDEPATCPYCGSTDSDLENPFGPTICRSLHYCRSCQQPFERFKTL
jgi:ring-1,2-phenylacetyl-CoA epoxidase subunit PaaD